jgi:hypothetical protein
MSQRVNAGLLTVFLIATLVALVSLVSCAGKKEEAAPATQTPSGEVSALVDTYQKLKALAVAGKVAQFCELRDSLTMANVRVYIEKTGGRVDSARINMWGENWPNVTGLSLVQDSTNGEWRRLTFTIPGSRDHKGREKSVYPVVLFRKNGSTWKVSNAFLMGSDKYDKNGRLILHKEMIYPAMFNLPPVFDELLK